ncbi:MAG: SMC-Scp complex subunit ScpB [Actinobacteria bacterium]|nr:SMC-Scp complex subunit ScpB [Actinomycetota bacterium]
MSKIKKDKSDLFYNDENWLKSCIEGIFFISEKPVTIHEICQALKINEKKAKSIIKNIEGEYDEKNGGFILRQVSGGYKFYSNPNLNDVLKDFVKSNIRTYLSQAALETLAVICYRQPVTRTQVAEIRGVRTDSVFQTLVEKGLIKDAGRLKEPGNPILYRTTDRFLEILGINSLKDLPPLKDFEDSNE